MSVVEDELSPLGARGGMCVTQCELGETRNSHLDDEATNLVGWFTPYTKHVLTVYRSDVLVTADLDSRNRKAIVRRSRRLVLKSARFPFGLTSHPLRQHFPFARPCPPYSFLPPPFHSDDLADEPPPDGRQPENGPRSTSSSDLTTQQRSQPPQPRPRPPPPRASTAVVIASAFTSKSN